jgi:hypothetical protein
VPTSAARLATVRSGFAEAVRTSSTLALPIRTRIVVGPARRPPAMSAFGSSPIMATCPQSPRWARTAAKMRASGLPIATDAVGVAPMLDVEQAKAGALHLRLERPPSR